MEQEIRFCATSAGRIAYAATGEGPGLVLPGWWVSHQEALWVDRGFRAFVHPPAAMVEVVVARGFRPAYDHPGRIWQVKGLAR